MREGIGKTGGWVGGVGCERRIGKGKKEEQRRKERRKEEERREVGSGK